MDIQPKLIAARFEQLEAGSLFIFPFQSGPGFALKVTPPTSGSRAMILPMGPLFPPGEHQPCLLNWRAETTVSFGKDFVFQLSTDPTAWSSNEPPLNVFCCGLFEGEVYLRANADPMVGYRKCWVRLDNGMLSWNEPPGIAAYSTRWEVRLTRIGLPPELIISISGEPFRAVGISKK